MATMFEAGDYNWNVRTFHTTDMFNTGQLTHNIREKVERKTTYSMSGQQQRTKEVGKFDRRRGVTNK
jgi:hypothetical protein